MLVSVIIPVYNVFCYLEKAVNSVLEQDLQDFEIILCNNSSDIACTDLCKFMAKNNKKIKLIQLPPKCGPGYARNEGMKIAVGKYIYFMDADDYIDPKTLSENVAIAEKYGCDMVKFGLISLKTDSNGNIISKRDTIQSLEGLYSFDMLKEHFSEYLDGSPNSVCLRLYKRSTIQNIRFEECTTAEDGIFNIDIFINGIESIYFNRKPYYYYVGRPSSIMGAYNPDRYKNELELLKHTERAISDWSNRNELMNKIRQMYVQAFLMEYNNFLLTGGDLTISEAAGIVKKIYNSSELQEAMKYVSTTDIVQPSARICYILSKHKMFRTAVLFKRIYIPISYFVNRLRMRLWNLIENQTV